MKSAPVHRCRVYRTPWAGAYGTHAESGVHYGKHFHATFGMGVVERGAQRSASGRGEVEAFAGDVVATNPGEVHDGRPLGGVSRRWRMVYFEPEVLAAFAGSSDFEIARAVMADPLLAGALRELFARLDQWEFAAGNKAAEALACDESLAAAFALLIAGHAAAASRRHASPEVSRIREWLGDALEAPPSLQELADMSGLSRYQVLRRFQQAHGLAPHAWVLQQRSDRARHLIRRGCSLAAAAAAAGFADQSHMTRAFRQRYGFTPGAWRKACNSVQDQGRPAGRSLAP